MKRLQVILLFITTMNMLSLCSDIKIRPATLNDCDGIARLTELSYNETFKPLYANIFKANSFEQPLDDFISEKIAAQNNSAIEFITKQLNQEGYGLLVAYDTTQKQPNQLVGYCRFNKRGAENIHVYLLAVDKNLQRNGIGSQLLLSAINTFAETKTCTLKTIIGNDSADTFYQKFGFENLGTVAMDPKTNAPSTDKDALPTHNSYRLTLQK